jgi:transketolase
VARGADPASDPDITLIGTGSEVQVALAAATRLSDRGIAARVVSMPSWELFEAQPPGYRETVLPAGRPAVSMEAGIAQGWSRYAQSHVSIERFGISAPGPQVLADLGITAERVAAAARELLYGAADERRSTPRAARPPRLRAR